MSKRFIRGSVLHNRHDPLDKGLVGEWRFDKNTGLLVPDYSGFVRHCDNTSGATWVTTPSGPGVDYGVSANGDYGTIADKSDFRLTSAGSVEVLYIQNANPGFAAHLVAKTAGSNGWMVYTTGANLIFSGVGGTWACGGDNVTIGGLSHAIGTNDGSIAQLYQNSINTATDALASFAGNDATDLRICRTGWDANNGMPATVLLLRFYDRVLTANEVRARYQIVRKRMQAFGGERRFTIAFAPSGATTSTSTTTSTSSSTSTTTTLAFSGGLAFGEESPVGETPVSWQTFSDGAAGLPTIVGDSDWGKIELDVPEEGRSRVYDFGDSDSRTITVTENKYGAGQQSATIQIRGQNAVFAQDDANPSWETYSAPTNKTWRYIQVRAYNQS